jgi:hypothetical protein
MMHMSNAFAGDPYPVDVLFMYMANMSWNSSMNSRGVMEMLEAKRDDGSYVIPKIIYSDAYSSEMVAYADLVLRTPHIWSGTTAFRCATGRSRSRRRLRFDSAGPSCRPTATCAASSPC